MAKYCFLILILLLTATSATFAADGAKCRLALYQLDQGTQENVLLFEDTSVFVKDLLATGFVGPFSMEIEFKEIDSILVAFEVHIVTLGPPTNTFSRSFTMEYDLPARLSGIESKNGSSYTLIITPLARTEVSDACVIDYRDVKTFTSMPSAFMDIYFMPSSLGDYNWESVRGYLDFEYRRYQTFANFSLPGKTLVYLCPCAAYSVIWDKRFGMAVDPTRNNVFAIVDKGINTADPFIITYVSLLRNYGYAPPFLAEGLANIFSLALYDCKQIMKDDPSFSLRPLLNTHNYYTTDPRIADRTSAGFVKYIVGTYGLSKFLDLYRAADDLNIEEKMESIYALPFDTLQEQWKHWLDTVSIHPREYAAAAGLAEQLFNYSLMSEHARNFLGNAASRGDSVEAFRLARKASFSLGDYYGAEEMQNLIVANDTLRALSWMTRGSYRMMNGDYEKALDDFQKAATIDTSNQMIKFNLALNHLYRADSVTARDILFTNISQAKGASAQGESRIFLAGILNKTGDSTQKETARRYLQETVAMYQQALSVNRSSPTGYMWLGMALTELGEPDLALEYLQVADFMEMRPFYGGMINLWLGKAYHALEQNDKAREHFSKVLSVASADYHQREARTYLEQP